MFLTEKTFSLPHWCLQTSTATTLLALLIKATRDVCFFCKWNRSAFEFCLSSNSLLRCQASEKVSKNTLGITGFSHKWWGGITKEQLTWINTEKVSMAPAKNPALPKSQTSLHRAKGGLADRVQLDFCRFLKEFNKPQHKVKDLPGINIQWLKYMV